VREFVLFARACAFARAWVFVRPPRVQVLFIRACVPAVFVRAGAAE
jgi:hypothetical protein